MAKLPRTFTADDAAPRWTSADMGEAIEAACLRLATKKGKNKGKVLVNAWWRSGDGLAIQVNVETGCAYDYVEGRSYGAKAFADIACGLSLVDFMATYGRLSSAPSRVAVIENRKPQVPAESVVASTWATMASEGPSPEILAWLASRGIDLAAIRSGVAMLTPDACTSLSSSSCAGWLRFNGRSGIVVAPLRSASTGDVSALQCRAISPATTKENKRRFVGETTDFSGTPRAYGFPHLVVAGSTVVLTEGMADTWAAESLLPPDVVVVGATTAGSMVKLAPFLKQAKSVVVVRHMDALSGDGAGQRGAKAVVDALAGVSSHFHWPDFLQSLLPLGFDALPHFASGFDLSDACRLCLGAGVDVGALARAFASAIGINPAPSSFAGGQLFPVDVEWNQ